MILVIMQLDKWVGGMEFSNLGAVVIGFTLFLFTEFIIGFSSNLYVVANRKNEKQKKRS